MRALLACASVMLGSAVLRADVVVVLAPEHAAPYQPGETLDIRISVRQVGDTQDHLIRGLALDFRQTDPNLQLNIFDFDYSTNPSGAFFLTSFEDLPEPAAVWQPFTPFTNPEIQWALRGDGLTTPIAVISVTLPDPLNAPLVLDALGSGGWVSYGFGLQDDPIVEFFPGHGLLGGRIVVPENGTLVFLAIIGLVVIGRRAINRWILE